MTMASAKNEFNNNINTRREEEEILAFGENYIPYPGGKIYLTIREMRRKINEMKLIATSKCEIIN